MWIPDLIQKKRDGATLADDEIRFFIDQLVHRRMENSQLGKQPLFDNISVMTSLLTMLHMSQRLAAHNTPRGLDGSDTTLHQYRSSDPLFIDFHVTHVHFTRVASSVAKRSVCRATFATLFDGSIRTDR